MDIAKELAKNVLLGLAAIVAFVVGVVGLMWGAGVWTVVYAEGFPVHGAAADVLVGLGIFCSSILLLAVCFGLGWAIRECYL